MDFGALISDIFKMQFGNGVPSWLVAALPFIIGIVIGYIIKNALKIGIMVAIVFFIASYFGFTFLSNIETEAKNLVLKYGPSASTYIVIFIGLLPLSIGLVIGIVIGFVF